MADPAIQGTAYMRHILCRTFETLHTCQGSPTADILRYTVSGGDEFSGIAPTAALVAGLTGLKVVMDRPGFYEGRSRAPLTVQLREGDREFWFLDIPAAGGVGANTLQATDRILRDGHEWYPLEGTIENDATYGCSIAFCRLTERG